jgi:tetratricopeptide (TPR) repeat protein
LAGTGPQGIEAGFLSHSGEAGKIDMDTNLHAIEMANSLHAKGRKVEAESLYRQVLQRQPDAVGALEGLGVLVFQQGRAGEAAPLFGRALANRPDSARLHANLGEALRVLGRPDEALEHLHRAVAIDPTFAQPWNSLGLLAFDQGRFAEAESAYRESIRLRPRFAAAYINLGNTLQALHRGIEAAQAQRAAVEIEPNNPLALINLGQVLCGLADPRSLEEAEVVSRRAVTLAPRLPLAIKVLENVLRLRDQLDGSAAAKTTGPRAASESAGNSFQRGVALLREGRHDEAESSFREALAISPTMATSWVGLSQVQAERGEIEPSCESARSALALSPKLAEAHWRLATTLRGRLPDAEVRAIERLIGDESLPEGALAYLRYGLAAVLDERGLYPQAAAHLEAASALQSRVLASQGQAHDPDGDSWFVDRMIAAFDADLFARGRGWAEPDPRPIFVVGLQRSGTSLVEQILASHPRIHGAGELRDVGRIFQSLPDLAGLIAGDSFDALKFLGPDSTRAAARVYLDRLDALAVGDRAARVVDKQPDNIRYLGLIALLWPGARVIVCSRDLRDVAVSCWLNGFAMIWSRTWEHIARRFADYQRIVDHWRRSGAVRWLDVCYEDLVDDLEGHARRLVDYAGLDWDPACLEFHSTRRVVRTPSFVQVRQPIHTQSVGRWKNYELSLQPLFRAIERHGVRLDLPGRTRK